MGSRKRPEPSRLVAKDLVEVSRQLAGEVDKLRFADPVAYVYNPLSYAWDLHREFLERYGQGKKQVLFLGMNPGPWGMAQTGVPFGEIAAVRDWMKLSADVQKPAREHPKRQIEGLHCSRSEVSGARLWGWAQDRFKNADAFFKKNFVTNYCPLVFMEESARNRTPDKLLAAERKALGEVCDRAFRRTVEILEPRLIVGVGVYAEKQAERIVGDLDIQVGRVLHPSPASPIANRGWAPQAEKQLQALGVI